MGGGEFGELGLESGDVAMLQLPRRSAMLGQLVFKEEIGGVGQWVGVCRRRWLVRMCVAMSG